MDVKSLSGWTRERLVAEAKRQGIEEAEALPRSEIIMRLMAAGGLQGLRRASQLPVVRKAQAVLSTAYLAAHSAAPRQMEALRNLAQRLPEVARRLSTWPPREGSSRSTPDGYQAESPFDSVYYAQHDVVTSASPDLRRHRPTDLEFRVDPACGDVPAEPPCPADAASPAEAAYPTEPVPLAGAVSPAEPVPPAGVVSPAEPGPPAGVASPAEPGPPAGAFSAGELVPPAEVSYLAQTGTRRFVEQPERSRGVARVLAEQGHRGLALGIYQELIAATPSDSGLRIEAEGVSRGETVSERHTAVGMLSPDVFQIGMPESDDRIDYHATGPDALKVSWQVSSEAVRRASAVLKQPGELTVRVICVSPYPGQVVRTETWEHGPVSEQGDWTAEQLPTAGRRFAAIGLCAGGRFVSIAHAEIRSE